VLRRLFLITMLAGSALITAGSIAYFDPDILPPFAIEKLPVRFEQLWLTSLKVHVATAAVAFPACMALMARAVQRRPRVHRWLGRVTGLLLLLVLVPSGAVLAFDAKGGALGTTGFLLSGAIVAAGVVHGVRAARRRDLVAHAHAMRHVVAQMSVAVSSRALIVALHVAGVAPEVAYVAALWGPVLGSAAFVELFSRRSSAINHLFKLQRMDRVYTSFATLGRLRAVVRPVARAGR
jgi:hypothetical protein